MGIGRRLLAGVATGVVAVLGIAVGMWFAAAPNTVSGTAVAPPPSGPFSGAATVDPCVLQQPGAYDGLHPAAVQMQPDILSACDVQVQLAGRTGYSVEVRLRGRVPSANREDGAGVTVTAQATGDAADPTGRPRPGVDPCAAADAGTDGVVAAVRSGPLPHLHYPKDSLGSVDLCDMLTPAHVDTWLAVRTVRNDPASVSTSCGYLSGDSADHQPTLRMSAILQTPDTWKQFRTDPTVTALTVAGRPVFYQELSDGWKSTGDHPACRPQATQKTWPAWPGRLYGVPTGQSGLVELFAMRLDLPRNPPLDCEGSVVALASIMLRRLPAPTP